MSQTSRAGEERAADTDINPELSVMESVANLVWKSDYDSICLADVRCDAY